jgi:hypothetical protein
VSICPAWRAQILALTVTWETIWNNQAQQPAQAQVAQAQVTPLTPTTTLTYRDRRDSKITSEGRDYVPQASAGAEEPAKEENDGDEEDEEEDEEHGDPVTATSYMAGNESMEGASQHLQYSPQSTHPTLHYSSTSGQTNYLRHSSQQGHYQQQVGHAHSASYQQQGSQRQQVDYTHPGNYGQSGNYGQQDIRGQQSAHGGPTGNHGHYAQDTSQPAAYGPTSSAPQTLLSTVCLFRVELTSTR